jgi:hypothetical protein
MTATRAAMKAAAAEARAAQAEAERDQALALVAQMEMHGEQAVSYVHRLSNPLVTLLVQKDGFGHWAIFLNAPGQFGAWTGTEWGPTDVDYTLMYRWTLPEARAEIDRLLARDAAEVAEWEAHRPDVAAHPTPIHEELAHREPTIADRMVSA